jgi:hypothetical protein
MTKNSVPDILEKGVVRLSRLNASLPTLRTLFKEGNYLEGIPLTAKAVAFRNKPADNTHGLIISYAAFLAFSDYAKNQGIPLSISTPQSARQFTQQSQDNFQTYQSLFAGNEPNVSIVTIQTSGNELATCLVVLAPELAGPFRQMPKDLSNLYSPPISGALACHLKEMFEESDMTEVRKPPGPFISTQDIRRSPQNTIMDILDDGQIAWLGNGSIAAIPTKTALQLKAILYPNNGHIIKPVNVMTLCSNHGRIFEEVRTQPVFYRVENRQPGREEELFTIIPDYVAERLNLDAEGFIHGIKLNVRKAFSVTTPAWVYSDLDTTKMIFTEQRSRVTDKNLRISLPDEQASIIRRALGFAHAAYVTINGKVFQCEGERVIDRTATKPKELIFPDTVVLRTRFNDYGKTDMAELDMTERPHFGEFVASHTQRLVIQAGGKEFVLAAA